MPRTTIELGDRIEYLAILDERGAVDQDLVPDLNEDTLRRLHRVMLLSRRFDERLLTLHGQGRIGTFAPVSGQEAAQVGAVAAIRRDDWMVPAFRETAAALWRGAPMARIVLYNAGYNEGSAVPEDSKDLPIAIPVATQLPHAAGIAYGARYRDTDEVVMTFFGDGATSEGDFHEALNFARVFEVPAIFVCQNNQYAISTPVRRQTKSRTLAQKALAYGMPGIQVDGNDVLAVYTAAREAVDRARAGAGPSLIECITYRLRAHTTADDPKKYRSEDEVARWRKRDPIDRMQRYLLDTDVLSEDGIAELEHEIAGEIKAAWTEAQEQMKALTDPLVVFDHVYAEPPPHLKHQREELARRLKRDEE